MLVIDLQNNIVCNSLEQILEYLLCARYDLGPKDDTVKQSIVSDLVYLN